MSDPFTMLLALAERLGLSQEQTVVGIGILGAVIGVSVISLVKGNILAAVRLVAVGMALTAFAVLSRVTGILSGL